MLYWVIEVEQMKLKKSESEMLCAFEHIDMEFGHYKCCIIIIKCLVKCGQSLAYKNMEDFLIWQLENKLFKAFVLWMKKDTIASS